MLSRGCEVSAGKGRALRVRTLVPLVGAGFNRWLLGDADVHPGLSSWDALLRHIAQYRLRAKVDVELREPLGVYLNLAGHPDNRPTPYADRAITFIDPRLAALGRRSIGAMAEMPANLAGPRAYHEHRIALGVPEGTDFGFEKTFALDAGLDELNGVSFTKGCYIGQELTSRMKHRATSRKRILTVAADAALPAPGASVTRGDTDIGELVSVYGSHGFALVRLDRLEETSGDVRIGEIQVALTKPAWLA